jgi:hypothetical protein
MSLLLQALKRIDAKPLSDEHLCPLAGDSETPPTSEPTATRDTLQPYADPREGSPAPAVVSFEPLPSTGVTQEVTVLPTPPPSEAIQLIRRYDESETVSAMAFAEPIDLENIAITAPQDDSPRRDGWSVFKRHHLADEILGLLPDESRGVLAIVPTAGIDGSTVALDVGEDLAAREEGEVLVITTPKHARSSDSADHASFSDVVVGRASWHDALASEPGRRLSRMAWGESGASGVSTRRLLKLWQEIGEQFAFVVLDAGGNLDNAMPIMATCDAAFIAVRLNLTHRHETERLIAQIRAAGCQPCGCLVIG